MAKSMTLGTITVHPPKKDLSQSKCPVHRLLYWGIGLKNLFLNKRIQQKESQQQSHPLENPEAAGKPRTEGKCPFGFDIEYESVFVKHAQADAQSQPVMSGDPEADELLAQTRQQIYHWPEGFKGFCADVEYYDGVKTHKGIVTFQHSGKIRYSEEIAGDEWFRFQMEEIISHREHPKVSRMASKSGVVFGDDDPVYGRQVLFCGDKMNSAYRIKDFKITQITRTYGGNRFIINIDEHEDCSGQFAARSYTAYYFSQKTGELTKSESFLDRFVQKGNIYLPLERRHTFADINGIKTRRVTFTNITLN